MGKQQVSIIPQNQETWGEFLIELGLDSLQKAPLFPSLYSDPWKRDFKASPIKKWR